MDEKILKLSLKKDTRRLKKRLLALIQENIPDLPNPESIAAFMETGMLPPAWLEEMFKQDIPSEKMSEIYDLMDFIHMDISNKSVVEEVAEENEYVTEIVFSEESENHKENVPTPKNGLLEKSKSHLEVEMPTPPDDSSVKTENIPENPIALPDEKKEMPSKKALGKQSPQKKKYPKKPSIGKTNFSQRKLFPEKRHLTEGELAERLFSGMINSVMPRKTLVLQELSDLVEQKLILHTVAYDPQAKELILYDETNNLAAKFSALEIEVILS